DNLGRHINVGLLAGRRRLRLPCEVILKPLDPGLLVVLLQDFQRLEAAARRRQAASCPGASKPRDLIDRGLADGLVPIDGHASPLGSMNCAYDLSNALQ